MRSDSSPIAAEPRERAVALVATLPVLVAATSAGLGIALGAGLALAVLATGVVAATFEELPTPARLALCALTAGAMGICFDLVSHAFTPDLRAAVGPFAFAIAPAALLHVAGSARNAGLRGAWRAAPLAFALLALVGAVREVLGRGTLFADVALLAGRDAAAWQVTLPWRGLLAAGELPGALLAVALLLAAFAAQPSEPRA